MSTLLPKQLYSAYRKEPISSFILIMGLVEGILGGFNQSWTLICVGLFFLSTSAAIRWLQIQKTENKIFQRSPRRYLPPSKPQEPLPVLKYKQSKR